jgi:SWI/SNF-related matrix-associated actin-dependent regulator 1 of chromatin subfamily A
MAIYAERPKGAGPWEIVSPFSRAMIEVCKQTPGVSWNQEKKRWVGSLDAVSTALRRMRDEKKMFVTTPQPPERGMLGHSSDARLRSYQHQGIAFLQDNAKEGCLLADDMGLGKSAQAIFAAKSLNAKNVLIVCPNAIKLHWASDIKKWLNENMPAVWLLEKVKARQQRNPYTGRKLLPPAKPPGHGRSVFFICNYDILHAWLGDLPSIDLIIFDEIHYLQTPKSRRSKAAKELCTRVPQRIGLTGTPITNRPRDFWNVIDTLRPGTMGSFFEYAIRYCGAYQEEVKVGFGQTKMVWNFDGHSHEEELHDRTQVFMLRRTKEDVKLELPKKTRQIIEIDVSKKYCMQYSASTFRDRRALRQCLNIAADGKIQEGIELVLEHARAGNKVVAFTYRRAVAEMVVNAAIEAGITNVGLINGGVPIAKRKAIIDSKPDILACTIDTCSTGIDLTYASHGVVLELVYVPHQLLQLEARLDRFGQTQPVFIEYLIARGTLDELIAGAIILKIDTISSIVGESEGTTSLGSDLQNRGEEDPLAALVAAFEGVMS